MAAGNGSLTGGVSDVAFFIKEGEGRRFCLEYPLSQLDSDEVRSMEYYWEDDYAIAVALKRAHPNIDPLAVDFETLQRWVVELPGFVDDKTVAAVYLLEAIQREWYEEVASNESAA